MASKSKQVYTKLTHINEDEEPCLRALHRKIRNCNKKLLDIKDTQGKGILKPEQLEKINRKHKFQVERDQCADFVTIYRQILLENEAHYRAQQLKEIDDLALVLTLMQSQGFKKKAEGTAKNILDGFGKLEETENATVETVYQQIKKTLTDLVNKDKIKNLAKSYYEQHSNEAIKTVPQFLNWQEGVQITKTSSVIKEEPTKNDAKAEVKGKKKNKSGAAKEEEESITINIKGACDQSQDVFKAKNVSQIVTSTTVQAAVKEAEKEILNKSVDQDKIPNWNRNHQTIKSNQNHGKKTNRSSKHLSNKSNPNNDENDDEDSEEMRNFNKEEIKQLQDDGFTVIQPKSRKGSRNDIYPNKARKLSRTQQDGPARKGGYRPSLK